MGILRKRLGIVTILVAILVLAVGCSGSKPGDAVAEFSDGMKEFDFEKMNENINPEDREDLDGMVSLEGEVEDEMEEVFLEYIKSNASEISYKINSSEVEDDKAVVDVEYTYVDGAPLFRATFEEYMKEVFGLAFTNLGEELTDEEYAEIFKTAMEEQMEIIEEPTVQKNLYVDCIKIDGQWYIDDPSEELLDVLMSNMITTIEEMDEVFEDFE